MRFSIIIPAYNAENFIIRSVKSVLNQTFEDFELIVVDDGSKDQTLERLKIINDERLVVIEQANQGVSVARNTGIQRAHGEFVCFLDADDEYLACHLDYMSKMIKEYSLNNFFVTRFCIGLISGKVIMPKTTEKITYIENAVDATLRNSKFVWTGCVCVKRDLFHTYGGFEPGVKLGEDTDMWKRLYVHTGVVCSDTVTVKYNRDGSAATKHYTRRYDADPLKRMPMFIDDSEISNEVKESLKTEYEWTKIQVVRSYLIDGNKKKAKEVMLTVDTNRIPFKRLLVTNVCFFVPSNIISLFFKIKNQGMYK